MEHSRADLPLPTVDAEKIGKSRKGQMDLPL